jgi:hypothetical protein
MKTCTKCCQTKPLDKFYDKNRSKVRADGTIHKWKSKHSRCKQCHYVESRSNLYKYEDYYKRYRLDNKEKIAVKSKRWYVATKQKWWDIIALHKELKCENCGYDKHSAALDFHHVNPSEKETTIHQLMNGPAPNGDNIEVFLAELNKCSVLCSNCHRETHAKYNFLTEGS